MSAGSSYTITFDVEYTLNKTVVCTWPGTIDGVRNTAYIRFANGQNSFSDTIAADNTSFVELEVDDHGVTDICEPQPPTGIRIKKRQVSPLHNSLGHPGNLRN